MANQLVADFDERVDALFDHIRGNPFADRVFYTASALGEFGLIWVVFALLRSWRGGRTHEKAALRAIVATGVESFLVNVVMKSLVRRHRPVNNRDHPLPLRQPLSSSFPSGHATAAFCGATLLSDGDERLAPLYFATALVVATSRVYVRIHHASDVVGGMAVGRVLGLVGKRLAPLGDRD
jgi:undecaprenyl-diphosphatase